MHTSMLIDMGIFCTCKHILVSESRIYCNALRSSPRATLLKQLLQVTPSSAKCCFMHKCSQGSAVNRNKQLPDPYVCIMGLSTQRRRRTQRLWTAATWPVCHDGAASLALDLWHHIPLSLLMCWPVMVGQAQVLPTPLIQCLMFHALSRICWTCA